jgi:hypothetical protein
LFCITIKGRGIHGSEKRNAYNFLVENRKGSGNSENLGVEGRILKWGLYVEWINVAQSR